jgi:L-seryl-tRNA(Ser) seleniumtransferase
MPDLSKLPSISNLLQSKAGESVQNAFGHTLSVKAMRAVLDELRQSAQSSDFLIPDDVEIIQRVREKLETWLEPTLTPVINATGVVLHTNLGRAPLSKAVIAAVHEAAATYTNLEYDLEEGKRGKRSKHASYLLSLLTGAEGGFVVNNNAGAVLLVLSTLAGQKNVLVSRTQLVEIGGGFRIPDVMRQSGAQLVEVGTTNRVHLYDYENTLKENKIALVLVAHHSNFKVVGFHSEPSLMKIVDIAHQYNVPVVHDLGSGALLDTADYGLAHEPTVFDSLDAGCDLVCFSGDKLFGGPQAGIIIGRETLLEPIRVHPLARALRPGKLTLAGVNANLMHYIKDEAESQVPIWQMIASTPEAIRTTAEDWREYLGSGEVVPGFSTVGGGSLPTEEMPTYLLALSQARPDAFMRALRESHPPIIARIEEDRILLDPRTVLPEQKAALLRNLVRLLGNPPE